MPMISDGDNGKVKPSLAASSNNSFARGSVISFAPSAAHKKTVTLTGNGERWEERMI